MTGNDAGADWQAGLSLVDACRHMLTEGISTDVLFLVGKEKTSVSAHKFILVCRSPVFQAMLSGDFADGRDPIEVPDIDIATFKSLLEFMYSDETKVTGENVLALLYASKKYGVNQLVKRCLTFLTDGQTVDNVCSILEQAHFYSEETYRRKCVDFIERNAPDVLQSDTFSDLCKDCARLVLSSDDLQCDEQTTLAAITSWAEKQCDNQGLDKSSENLRTVLGDVLYLVRFPLLDKTYFTNVVSENSLLIETEVLELFKYFYKTGAQTKVFETKPRNIRGAISGKRSGKKTHTKLATDASPDDKSIQTCVRFSAVCEDGSWYCGGETDAIAFSVESKIWLHGILVYGSYIGEGSYDVRTCVLDNADAELVKINTSIRTTEQQLTYVILFENAIPLEEDKKYIVTTKLTNAGGVDTYQGLNGKVNVDVNNVRFTFSKTRHSRNGTDVKIGQIPGLLFSTTD
ncbi:BTBD6-like protein [Mya arenaria]|uniref:BTBD6-like protein n=1 Tax=Mya arenaria TaxID=6604 RepID=A0ABY7FTX8_MYAAR|nr:BTB/POZ domain-containing protein 6-B-like [Mya arenaria]WAR25067.1 BTBD6-like protein [Mya arenaria]